MEAKAGTLGKDSGQVSSDAAKVYEQFFVPALFQEWGPRVAQAAHVQPGDQVLDVACGTGVLARYIHEQVSPGGQVTGLDINEGMLAVAAQLSPGIEWEKGDAASLPYADNCFDAVVCQFGLMFFHDPGKAIKEMMRVLKPGKYLAVAVWDALENAPGYEALTRLLQRQFSDAIADKLRAPFTLGNARELVSLFSNAGVDSPQLTTTKGSAQFPSIRSWVYTDVRGWVLSEFISDEQLDKLIEIAEKELDMLTDKEGKVRFDISAHIVSAKKGS